MSDEPRQIPGVERMPADDEECVDTIEFFGMVHRLVIMPVGRADRPLLIEVTNGTAGGVALMPREHIRVLRDHLTDYLSRSEP